MDLYKGYFLLLRDRFTFLLRFFVFLLRLFLLEPPISPEDIGPFHELGITGRGRAGTGATATGAGVGAGAAAAGAGSHLGFLRLQFRPTKPSSQKTFPSQYRLKPNGDTGGTGGLYILPFGIVTKDISILIGYNVLRCL